MKSLRHIMRAVVAIVPILFGACNIYDRYPIENDPVINQNTANLVLHIGLATPTRAQLRDNEMMHSLRVVLLNADGTVEYNEAIDKNGRPDIFGGSQGQNDGRAVKEIDYSLYKLIPTTPGHKKIFLIANEESVEGLADVLNVAQGSTGFENTVNSYVFTPDFDKNILLSACYEFDIAEGAGEVDKNFWLVHAASKFEFTFINHRTSNVTVQSLTVSKVAESMYLMANVDADEMYKELPDNGGEAYWIYWLKAVCDATNQDPDLPTNKDVNEKYGWIYGYEIPQQDHTDLDIRAEAEKLDSSINWTIESKGGTVTLPEIYCAESKYTPESNSQKYNFSINLFDEADNGVRNFERELENLQTLFRNTHVKVTVTMAVNNELELEIGICPWYQEDIDIPTFD